MPTGLIIPKCKNQDALELEFYLKTGTRKFNKMHIPGEAPIDKWFKELVDSANKCDPIIVDKLGNIFIETEGFFSDKEAQDLSDSIKKFKDNCKCLQ